MRPVLALELLLIFVLLPSSLAIHPLPFRELPILWLVALYGYLTLRRDRGFHVQGVWRPESLAASRRSILMLFLPAACLLALAVRTLTPSLFLAMPRQTPLRWARTMLLYPFLSVIPQTFVYRTFFLRRYAPLVSSTPALILLSALAFSWMHIVLRNPVAPLLALPAGVLFAWRYVRTQSLLASAVEHALYGCLVFTVGLGVYFYSVTQ